MSGTCLATAVTAIGTFALSTTEKAKIISDPHVCLFIANVKSASAELLSKIFFAFRNFTGTVVAWRLPSWLSAIRGIK